MSESKERGGARGFWGTLSRPRNRYSILTLVAVFFAGIIFWSGFNTAMEATNTLEFCISCHELRNTVYPEYKETIHYSNRSGVRAICSDCHVPKDFSRKILRKIEAANDVWGHLVGTIDTPEKFEAKRHELATREWARMKASDSQACRNCHSAEAMSAQLQTEKAQRRHQKAEGKTCIDCHFGLAHKEPEGPGPQEMKIGK